MVNKKFGGQVTALVLVNLIIKLIWIFFIERKVQLQVGFEAYGLYYSIFSFTLILGVINDPGLSNYLIRFISNQSPTKKHLSQLFLLKIILSFAYLTLGIFTAIIFGFHNYQLLAILITYQILWSFLIYLRAFLKAHQHLNVEIIFSIIDKFLLIITLAPLLYLKDAFLLNIYFYGISQVLAVLISIIICVFYLKKHQIVIAPQLILKPNFAILKPILPFALFAFLVLAYNKIDVLMLRKFANNGELETGIYAAAYRFLEAANMLPILFASLFYPLISKIIVDNKNLETYIKPVLGILMSISIIICLASWFNRNGLMQLFYGVNDHSQLALIFGVLMLSFPFVTAYYIYSTILTANHNLKFLNIISGLGLILNIGLNLAFIPRFGALGAAVSSLFTFLFIGLADLVFYHRYLHFKLNINIWLRLISFTFLLIALGNLLIELKLAWLINMITFSVIAILIALLLKLFNIKSIKQKLLQNNN